MRLVLLSALVLAAACSDSGPTEPKVPPGVLSLEVGGVRTLTPAEVQDLRVNGPSGGAEYALVPFFASQSAAATIALEFAGELLTSAAGPPTPDVTGPAASLSLAGAALDGGFERRIRRAERTELAPRMAAARAARARAGGASLSVSRALLPVGSEVTLNAEAEFACSNPSLRTGRVVAETQFAVVVADNANPTGGFTDAEYAEIAVAFDTLVYPLITQNFGTPGDLDANGGRNVIFFTRAVNELTPAGSQFVIGGFFHPRDLFPKTGTDACAGSNESEMFYMLVPDPGGEVNGNVRSKTSVQRQTIGVLAHEFQHLINASRRIYVNGADEFEDVWLNEGLSHIAEELMFYRASGLAPRQNIGLSKLRSSQKILDAVNAYQVSNIARLIDYIEDPETQSPYADDDELATRGATWQLLRYAADRSTTPERTLWFNLANSKTTGIPNVAAVTGTDFLTLVRDWAVAQYTDDAGINVAATFTHPSWNFRSVIPALVTATTYPLMTRSLGSNAPASLTLDGGGAAYLRFGVAASTVGKVKVTSAGATPPPAVQLTLVRTK